MIKTYLIILLVFCFSLYSFSQSKKDEIVSLNIRIDSLSNALSKQSNTILELALENQNLNIKFSDLNKSKNLIKDSLENKQIKLNKLILENDSISVLYFNQISFSNLEWTNVSKYENDYGNKFKIDENDNLLYNEKIIKRNRNSTITHSIKVSPLSNNKKFVIYCTNDEQNSKLYLCNLETHTSNLIDLKETPILWQSWSPNLKNVIISGYHEGYMTIYNFNLESYFLNELEFDFDIKMDNDNYPLEEISYDLENIKWVSESLLSIKVNISCQAYSSDDNCGNEERNIILRSYTIIYDVLNNGITNKILNK